MKSLSIEQIVDATGGRWVSGCGLAGRSGEAGALFCNGGVASDTRSAKGGDLFFALKGERFDGHRFLAAAGTAGCVAAVVNRDADVAGIAEKFPLGLILVADTTRALGDLAAWHRRNTRATVVGVTGSNGKTTVKRMIHHILSKRLRGSCSPKSFNNNVGVPLTLLAVGEGDDYVVCEIGTNAPGEIAALAQMVRPDVAVITSVSATHLEKLGSIERVAAEKASMLGFLDGGGAAVVWADSDVLGRAVRPYDVHRITFGQAEGADLRLSEYQPRDNGQVLQINGRLRAEMPLVGRHNAINALAAIAVAQRFGFSQDEAAAAMGDFAGVDMRLQRIDLGGVSLLNDAYNANPASVLAAADVLADCKGRRRVMIVGDMRELGPEAQELHVQTGRSIAKRGLDLMIGVGELGRYIAQGASGGGMAAVAMESVQQATARVTGLLAEGDVVLLKGSRAMAMERLVEPIRAAFASSAATGSQRTSS